LPSFLLAVVDAARRGRWPKVLPLVVLFGLSLVVPQAYLSRFILGVAMAALLAMAYWETEVRRPWLRAAFALAFVALACVGFWKARVGAGSYGPFARHLAQATRLTPLQRATLQIEPILWPTRWALQKEAELQEGDTVTYDESGYFLGELGTRDFRTHTRFVPVRGDVEGWLARLQAVRPRWVGVRAGSAAAQALTARGGEYLFVAPHTALALYRYREPSAAGR
jgi:hypothetical protein